MKHLSLAAKYRPQKFSEVVGQQMAAAALSRAAREDRVAPAYLLSGTRGVGKTTIARIFAKALNCERAPTGEPCNECSQCAQIAAGIHTDVLEIDGASNTGVDDVRALRENVGYMPMQGRYKVFIMDEAHMLSKSAFNALLKTLEEPPARALFIFATTEARRFPATIVSRCQHFVFQHQPEEVLLNHLLSVLQKEGVERDPAAVRLIAKRAAGSVRDSLSLLDQTLALAGDRKLDSGLVRQSLGLAGLEFFQKLLKAIPARSCSEIIDLCGSLLGSGADIGFFMRELASIWRNLFLYKREGDKILPSLALPPDEAAFIKDAASLFSPAHLHAAWQMTLEHHKSVTQSPEPGPGLELFLLNLALLPQLMPVGAMDTPPSAVSSAREDPGQAPSPAGASESGHPSSAPADQPRLASGGAASVDEEPKAYGAEPEAAPPRPDAHKHSDLWKEFVAFCASYAENGGETLPGNILRSLTVRWDQDRLRIAFPSELAKKRFFEKKRIFDSALKNFCADNPPAIDWEEKKIIDKDAMLRECGEIPQVKLWMEIMGGDVAGCRPKNQEI